MISRACHRLLVIGLLLSVNLLAFAYDFEVDGLCYNITSQDKKTVELTYKIGSRYEGDVTIPSSVAYEGNTYAVTAIGRHAFCWMSSDSGWSSNSELKSVKIPNSVTSIGNCAFSDCI